MSQIRKLSDVVDWRLCLGCGACAYICPEKSVQLKNFPTEGIRPVVAADRCGTCTDCLEVCPAVQSDFRPARTEGSRAAFEKEWGPVLEVWEGHATDAEIRYKGSSGGALTALAAHCIEQEAMHGVLHIGADPENPLLNTTRLSRSRGELMSAMGSRYSPASVCDKLGEVEAAPAPCAIIGKPVEISAVRNAARLRPALARNVGVTFSFFCAESPSTAGTVALLKRNGVNPDDVQDLRYRGNGWPGNFAATCAGDKEPRFAMTYRESWAFLQSFRPWSTQLWPDGTGELADISCGDPWYDKPDGKNPGFSLIVVRTQRGAEIIRSAMAAGVVQLRPAEQWKLAKSQGYLLKKKGSIWGRRLMVKLLGLPVTRFPGLDLRHCWKSLPLGEKLRATVGTLRRLLSRRLYRPLKLGETALNVRPTAAQVTSR